ncbi:hypothetical protein PGTUg99_002023 [Puccinia graminis f. sp. tritici]|uniref:Uncharacterized protein n=1 Tax=Puccinia graminis f. sp. tritici TaxID=56615 RepID=A0A5B0NLQ3_PUCGR|nr:hypothetical protein PGTUg99_002023 [Puccinia graminis f. sp. tritici]
MRGKPRTMTQLTSYQRPRRRRRRISPPEDQDCLRGFPILVGLSRKQFLAKLLTLPPPVPLQTTTPPPPLLRPDQQLIPAIVASTIDRICNGAH